MFIFHSSDSGKFVVVSLRSVKLQPASSFSHLEFSNNNYMMVVDIDCQNDHTKTGLLGFHALLETTW